MNSLQTTYTCETLVIQLHMYTVLSVPSARSIFVRKTHIAAVSDLISSAESNSDTFKEMHSTVDVVRPCSAAAPLQRSQSSPKTPLHGLAGTY